MPTVLVFAFLAFGGSLLWALTHKKASAIRTTKRVSALCLLGDSLAVGLKPYFEGFARERGLPFIFDAKVGRFIKQQSLDSVPAESFVFVSLGTNDATSTTNVDYVPALVRALYAKGVAQIVWLLPPATKNLPGLQGIRSAIWANIRSEVPSRPNVIVVQTKAVIRSDGLHPANYAQVFQDILPVLAF